jgi:hypothetical protein
MKHIIKYLVTILISILFFIIGDIAVKGAWLNRIDNADYILNHKLGVDKLNKSKIILIKFIAEKNNVSDVKFFDGLTIQVMNTQYKELINGVIRKGIVQFDLSCVSRSNKLLVIISPITGNEITINSELSNFEMKLDASELLIKQKANKKRN